MSQRGDEYITIELHVSRPWKRFRTQFFRHEQSPGRKFIFFSFLRWRRADGGGEIGDHDPIHGPAKPCTHWCAREKNVYLFRGPGCCNENRSGFTGHSEPNAPREDGLSG